MSAILRQAAGAVLPSLAVLSMMYAPPVFAGGGRSESLTEAPQSVQVITQDLLYQTIDGRDVKADVAVLIKTLSNRSMVMETSIVSYARGADFRRIETREPVLLAGLERIRPILVEKVYVKKSSVAAPVAPILFSLIGTQYEGPGAKAAATPGQVCPVTGQPLSEGGHAGGRGDTARAIDKAGMTAGLGLLTSQAKGDLEGLKLKWEIPSSIRYESLKLSFDTFNKNSKRSEPLSLSIAYDPQKTVAPPPPVRFIPIRFNASVESGPVVTQQEFTVTPQQRRQFRIAIFNLVMGKGEAAKDWQPRNSQLEYAADDYWDDFEDEWDDFDEDGYCHECGFYEPRADEMNYDRDGNYLGDTRLIPEKLSRVFVDPERNEPYAKDGLMGQKLIYYVDYPVTRALFKTEAVNTRTNELIRITTPVIIKNGRDDR